ncbi:DUF4833 domain-containing protein [Pedobacter faecalis]|uniref:DUF4833 domain-containing protein n=1 Tax=Pedobacter faecalis TaxID=3041495 RepID=UPI00254EE99B|nr:DUF4833 domain-containing protein [Pedobacter sp. ELA7]
MNSKFIRLLLLAIHVTIGTALAQTADNSNPSPLKFPVPKGISNQLFYLQRDPNINTIICELNVDAAGNVNRKEPVHVYWLRYSEDGKKAELNYIQRKFAYGIQTRELGKDYYELKFVSRKEQPLYLQRSAEDNKFHVYINVNKKKIILERIFLRIQGGSFWLPDVKYVELKGVDANTKAAVIERIKV